MTNAINVQHHLVCTASPHNNMTLEKCCRRLKLEKVGVTNGVMRALSGLTGLEDLHLPLAHRITDVGLAFLSTLTDLR